MDEKHIQKSKIIIDVSIIGVYIHPCNNGKPGNDWGTFRVAFLGCFLPNTRAAL